MYRRKRRGGIIDEVGAGVRARIGERETIL